MRIQTVHSRSIAASAEAVGSLLDSLASSDDRLWPCRSWPPMRLDRGLSVGSAGGHAFVRYRVVEYEPGRVVRFEFSGPRGLTGRHGFTVAGDGPARSILTHDIRGRVERWFALAWVAAVGPLHDALMEDCLDGAVAGSTGTSPPRRRHSMRVRALRRIAARFA
jgi:hypothetical protein